MRDGDRPSVARAIDVHRLPAVHVVTLCGLGLIGAGVFLPWVSETRVVVYVLGMESGFERQWGKRLLLGAVLGTGPVLASLTPRTRWSFAGPILAGIGIGVILVAIFTTSLTGQ